MKKLLFCFVMLFGAFSLFAQPAIQFEKTTHDFGNIKEEGGKVTGKFEFTNTGNQDLLLTSVKPGCGCTAADYTKTPVPPGGKGFINATYDAYNRPGNFNKNIKVTTNEPKFSDGSSEQPYVIYIKGNVEKKPASKYETAGYTIGNGNVRIKDNNVKINLLSSETKSFTVQVKNFLEQESRFEPLNFPNYITVEKTTLKAGEEKNVTFRYDAAKRGDFGNFKDVITIQTDDATEPNITIVVESNITEDFSKMTKKQLKVAPIAVIDTTLLNFGKVEKNSTPTKQVKLQNTGKNPLIIRQLTSSNNTFSVVSDKMEIPKGDFATLTITLISRNKRGVQTGQIEMVTNCPAQSKITLNCRGEMLQ